MLEFLTLSHSNYTNLSDAEGLLFQVNQSEGFLFLKDLFIFQIILDIFWKVKL